MLLRRLASPHFGSGDAVMISIPCMDTAGLFLHTIAMPLDFYISSKKINISMYSTPSFDLL